MQYENVMPYAAFHNRLAEYLQLCAAIEKVSCPQLILLRRDELEQDIREAFCDADDNLNRWRTGKPYIYLSPETHKRVEVPVPDAEALYQFLLFCYDIQMYGKINEDRRGYLAYLLSRRP